MAGLYNDFFITYDAKKTRGWIYYFDYLYFRSNTVVHDTVFPGMVWSRQGTDKRRYTLHDHFKNT